MKTNKIQRRLLVSVLILFQSIFSYAQDKYVLNNEKSSLKVTGTSTLHDWHMDANIFSGEFTALFNEQNDLVISSGDFVCDAVSITSDNSIMDDKAHDALDTDRFKQIKFNIGQKNELVINGGTIDSKISGVLQISGQKKIVLLPVSGIIEEEENINFNGQVVVKMSSFNIKPPTALMGTIKTGDEVTIHYHFIFKKVSTK